MGSAISGVMDFLNPLNHLTKFNPAHQAAKKVAPGFAKKAELAVNRGSWGVGTEASNRARDLVFSSGDAYKEYQKNLVNPIGAALGEGNIVSKVMDPVPGSFIPGQTGITGIIDNPVKGLINSTGGDALLGAGKSVLNTAKDALGGIGSLLGGGEEGGEEQQSGGNLSGNPDDGRTSQKRILRGGNSRRRRGFSGGPTSLSPSSGGTTTLLGG
jgi:hypothetical protein